MPPAFCRPCTPNRVSLAGIQKSLLRSSGRRLTHKWTARIVAPFAAQILPVSENGTKQEYGSALNKALAVLEMITSQPQAIGLPDLAARLEMPRQTVHRILRQLETQNLIIRDPTRDRFFVGPRLSQLSIAALFSENHNLPTRAILR